MFVAQLETTYSQSAVGAICLTFGLKGADLHFAPDGAQLKRSAFRCYKHVVPNGTHSENLNLTFSQTSQQFSIGLCKCLLVGASFDLVTYTFL